MANGIYQQELKQTVTDQNLNLPLSQDELDFLLWKLLEKRNYYCQPDSNNDSERFDKWDRVYSLFLECLIEGNEYEL